MKGCVYMECGCKQLTKQLLLEGEYGADPVWCAVCQYNIEIDELAVSDTLLDELLHWGNAYGQWVDLEQGVLIEGGAEMEVAYRHLYDGGRCRRRLVRRESVGQLCGGCAA